MASRVAPPVEDKGAEVDGAEEAEGVIVLVWGRLNRSYASLRLTVAASMAFITVKWGDLGKQTKKMAKDLPDSRKKNELITSHRIPIDIYKG